MSLSDVALEALPPLPHLVLQGADTPLWGAGEQVAREQLHLHPPALQRVPLGADHAPLEVIDALCLLAQHRTGVAQP